MFSVKKVWILISITSQMVLGSKCPNEEVFEPCTCEFITSESFSTMINLDCTTEDIEKVYGAIDHASKKSFRIFKISINNNKVEKLRDNLFKNAEVTEVELNLPNLQGFSLAIFQGQFKSLNRVRIISTNMDFIPIDILNPVVTIEHFSFKNSKKVMKVEADGFEDIPCRDKIETLDYSDNNIEVIGQRAFQHLVKLRSINLSNNKLSFISSSHLKPNIKLPFFINLRNNILGSIPTDILQRVPNFSKIHLASNKISDVAENDLKTMIRKGMPIELEGNPLNCNCSFVAVAIAVESGLSSSTMQGHCSYPMELKQRSIGSLRNEDFSNC